MKTIYLANKILDTNLAGATVKLYRTAPTSAGNGTEITDAGYTAQAVAFATAVGGVTENTGDIVFGPATETWAEVTHLAVFDGVNMLYGAELTNPKTLDNGDRLEIGSGDLTITEELS